MMDELNPNGSALFLNCLAKLSNQSIPTKEM